MVGNNFPKHKLIIPTLCVGMQPEPLCGSGRWSGPDWVTTQSITAIKLSVVGAGRARDIALVPKLWLGNPVSEAPASQVGKLELPRLRSQALPLS